MVLLFRVACAVASAVVLVDVVRASLQPLAVVARVLAVLGA